MGRTLPALQIVRVEADAVAVTDVVALLVVNAVVDETIKAVDNHQTEDDTKFILCTSSAYLVHLHCVHTLRLILLHTSTCTFSAPLFFRTFLFLNSVCHSQ